jgi:hypothetical protein
MNTLLIPAAPRRLWTRATQALGRLWTGMISLPERSAGAPRHQIDDYPRYPWF